MTSIETQPVSEIMFRGLAVRMVIATGHVERCQKHAISNRVEYQGLPPSSAGMVHPLSLTLIFPTSLCSLFNAGHVCKVGPHA